MIDYLTSDLIRKCMINHIIMFDVLFLNLNSKFLYGIKLNNNETIYIYVCIGLGYYLIKCNDI
jgi:hypothetical protein